MSDSDIDQSCWIPQGEAIITPERLAKGDVSFNRKDSGEMLEIQLTIRNILNYLHEQEIITDQHLYDAQTYQIWQQMHRVQRGLEKPVSSGNPQDFGVRLRAHGFILLLQRLSKRDVSVIEFAINSIATEHTRFIANNNRGAYPPIFERLSQVLSVVREQISYLEGLSENEMDELSEERLKKCVAYITKRV